MANFHTSDIVQPTGLHSRVARCCAGFMLLLLWGVAPTAFAAGDVADGKRLFKDPHLADSRNDDSCNSCHRRGEGLADAAHKQQFRYLLGLKKRSLEGMVNWCITKPLRGRALAADSSEMRDIIAYIRSL